MCAVTNTLAQDYVVRTNNTGKWRNFVTQCQLAAEHLMTKKKTEYGDLKREMASLKKGGKKIPVKKQRLYVTLSKYINAGINLEKNPTPTELFDFMVTFYVRLDCIDLLYSFFSCFVFFVFLFCFLNVVLNGFLFFFSMCHRRTGRKER